MKHAAPFDLQSHHAAARVLAAYRDQPTLCLTTAQAACLCQLDIASASAALDALTQNGYLRRIGAQFWLGSNELVACG